MENSGDISAEESGWAIAEEPFLSIGTFQGDSLYQLFQVQGAMRLADGRITVANGGSGEVRVYDSDGRFLSSHGRKGEGPGEFQRPSLVGVLGGDTLVVVDNQLRRISLIHADDGFLESTRLSDELGGGGFPRGMFADRTLVIGGGFYFSSSSGMELSDGYSRRETGYASAGLDGELVTDFGQFPGSEFFMQVQSQSGGMISMSARLIPFGKYAMQAVGPDRFFFGSGDSWEIEAYDLSGRLRTLMRLDRDPFRVEDADLAAVIEEEIAEADDPSQAPEIRAGYEDFPVPDFMPAFAGLHADAFGFLWVERYRKPGDDMPVFDIVSPVGALVGTATLPSGSDVLEIGDDYVLVLQRDQLEVEYLRLFSLNRPAAR
ncbi:MAG: hypothetical protein HKO65_06605 [Gemmatimonadetes bacterium]|nr:hypothetical protein [Gemmatimonadota bacterium]